MNLLIDNTSNFIVTQDKDRNLKYGILSVNNPETLKKIRDALLCYSANNYTVFGSLVRLSSSCVFPKRIVRDGNSLIFNGFVCNSIQNGYVSDSCEYSRKVYQNNYLNTILIATSLLNDLDGSNFDSLVQSFIGNGIVRCLPIEKIWPSSSQNMYNDFTQNNIDLVKFCDLLKEKIISYEIVEEISRQNLNSHEFSSRLIDLNQIEINSNILLGENSAFIRKKIR